MLVLQRRQAAMRRNLKTSRVAVALVVAAVLCWGFSCAGSGYTEAPAASIASVESPVEPVASIAAPDPAQEVTKEGDVAVDMEALYLLIGWLAVKYLWPYARSARNLWGGLLGLMRGQGVPAIRKIISANGIMNTVKPREPKAKAARKPRRKRAR
jgi:hypothetical protein